MRPLILASIAVWLLFFAGRVSAQDITPSPLPPPNSDEIIALATQVAATADELRALEDRAGNAFDQASNFLGIFEAIGLIVSILSGVIAVLAIVGGLVGFRGLNEARNELETTRERVESDLSLARQQFDLDMEKRRNELELFRQQMERSDAEQRENAARANLSMSFLPLGDRQYRSQDFTGALDTYNRALELDPNNLITHYRLGYVHTQSGNLDKAQEHLTRALEIEKDFAPALAALGYVYRRIGEKMETSIDKDLMLNRAENLLLRGLAISPKLIDEDGESWWGSLGGLYRRRGQVDEAINAYERAGQITPQSSYAFSNLALLYVLKKDRDAMIRTYQRVEQLAWGEVQADVDNYWAYADLLTARLALGKIMEAEETLTMVLETAPSESPYVFQSLLDTLQRLEIALGDETNKHLSPFIAAIEAQVQSRNGDQSA